MPRPKGPEKVAFKVMVTTTAFAWLTRKANGKAVPTYLAEQLERQAEAGIKNERQVSPRLKGKK